VFELNMNEKTKIDFTATCPTPIQEVEKILLAHGGGGRLMHQLLENVIAPALKTASYEGQHDSAVLELNGTKIAYTTDSFVVSPLFFKGGDIGKLAVYGTVNDLAMSGAKPLFLSLGLILEEGFPVADLKKIMASIRQAADEVGVSVVTGDTKVVDRGKGDGLFINTSGIGLIEHTLSINPRAVQPGDAIVLSGDLGRHGIAIMAEREGLEFESSVESDCAPLSKAVLDLLAQGIDVHCLRDLTRGGLASSLNEIANVAKFPMEIEEGKIPLEPAVRAACELLGFDPLYVANEGRFVAFVPPTQVDKTISLLKSHASSQNACWIGIVQKTGDPIVVVKNQIGSRRILDMLSGEQLPRIC
jgi:hydrogenase expression/formation protein HypE